jgi:hypothetical protein
LVLSVVVEREGGGEVSGAAFAALDLDAEKGLKKRLEKKGNLKIFQQQEKTFSLFLTFQV